MGRPSIDAEARGNFSSPTGVLHSVRRLLATLTSVTVLAGACMAGQESDALSGASPATDTTGAPEAAESRFPPPPEVPTGPLAAAVVDDLDTVFMSLTGTPDIAAAERLGGSGDPRIAWLLSDIMRFVAPGSPLMGALTQAWIEVTGTRIEPDRSVWGTTTDHLIAWDTPAPPGYVDWKRIVFELVEVGWRPFFADADAAIDWRHVSWGGVLIDDRELDQTDGFCIDGCIPALNDPALVRGSTTDDWLDDDFPVFGVMVDDEAVAFPKNIMEIHEMVNITIGGRRLGIPYCTLCGSAQAYFTDVIDDLSGNDAHSLLAAHQSLELRTSALQIRSNKVMYEFHTKSVFDTFTGEAVSGPLRQAGLRLDQTSVLATTWGAWKAAHPDSWLIAEDGGIGRYYPPDPLAGRDDDGPIFPIGDVDPRLGVQDPIVGVIAPGGAVAFSRAALDDTTDAVTFGGVTITATAGGYTATTTDGATLAAHEAFWFAWSQFHPDTGLWTG